MNIYPRTTVEASARQAAAAFVKGQDAHCPYPEWHEAATIWRDTLAAEVDRLREEVAA